MPIRFQVDPDFYDHVKTLGMSDAAFSLWVRAGSYSAAKLTDGFLADNVFKHVFLSADEAAAELVTRGLWKRVRGGFQFHEWDERNLTRNRVLSDRERERDKKRRQREARSEGDLSRGDSPGESAGTPDGSPAGSPDTDIDADISLDLDLDLKPKNKARNGHRLSEDFEVTADMVEWARLNAPHVDGRRETEKFRDYWSAKSGRDAAKVDWTATWRNWMRNAADRTAPPVLNGNKPSTTDSRVNAGLELARRYAEEDGS